MIVENKDVIVNTDTMEHQQPKEVKKFKIKKKKIEMKISN